MKIWQIVLAVYLIGVNGAAFAAFGIDKQRAIKRKWRIQERTLILFAMLGGSPGAILGMYTFRHKTRRLRFTLGIPVIMAMQVCTAYGLIRILWS